MCSICDNEDEIWNLFLRVIKRDHPVPETKRKKGGGAGGLKTESKPMNSPNELLPFFVLPDNDKKELLEDVVAGRIKLAAARKIAEQRASETRAFREVEKIFNAQMGQLNSSRAKKKNLWVSYDKIVQAVPTLPGQLQRFKVAFSKVKLVPIERTKFNSWVSTVVDAYKKATSSSSSKSSSSSVKAGSGIPRSFQVLVHKNQKKIKEGDERKWFFVESLSGPPTAAMLINDTTQNLRNYIGANEAELGKCFLCLTHR